MSALVRTVDYRRRNLPVAIPRMARRCRLSRLPHRPHTFLRLRDAKYLTTIPVHLPIAGWTEERKPELVSLCPCKP